MSSTFAFTYVESDGSEGRIGIESMRKLWVDHDCTGIVFIDVSSDGLATEHEVVLEGQGVAEGMADVMQTLLTTPAFERVELPVDDALLLEFRYPCPSTVALSYRA